MILLDTNVILDIALNRKPFVKQSGELIRQIENHNITAFITASAITDIYYIAKRNTGHEKSIDFLQNLLEIIKVASVDETTV
ncbi:MAG: PIN domain-containing protein, partial [Bacteroidales bacterium]|nr:PIN domain-containing protein [Bacteroidales bacterium]